MTRNTQNRPEQIQADQSIDSSMQNQSTSGQSSDHSIDQPMLDHSTQRVIKQPMTPEEVDPAQKQAHKQMMAEHGKSLVLNPGDFVDESKSLQEKAQQVAVDVPDITGDHIVVPTYFIVNYPDGSQKALHHVRDAEAISDVIRQARMDENGNRLWW